MRSFFLPVAIAAVFLSTGCSTPRESAAADPVFGSDADPVFFMLERTPCFGTCPSYRITVDRSGKATYIGRDHVERKGTYTAQVDRSAMVKLLERADRIGFFTMQDKYDSPITDVPSTIIRVNANGKDKKVVGRHKTPSSFRPFAELADSLLLPLSWTKVNDEQ